MFLHDRENDIYHLFGTGSEETRCGLSAKGMWTSLVADESNKGKECEACKQVKETWQHREYENEVIDNF